MACPPPKSTNNAASTSDESAQDSLPRGVSHRFRSVYRCRRCAQRKFRTTRDLATHILAKHTHVHLVSPSKEVPHLSSHKYAAFPETADEIQSVTLTSPPIPAPHSADMNAVLATIHTCPSPKSPGKKANPLQKSQCSSRPLAPISSRTSSARFTLTHTISSSQPSAPPRLLLSSRTVPEQSLRSSRSRPPSTECTGPSAHDVYVRACRSGQVRVVPVDTQPAQTLNFAYGLF